MTSPKLGRVMGFASGEIGFANPYITGPRAVFIDHWQAAKRVLGVPVTLSFLQRPSAHWEQTHHFSVEKANPLRNCL
jgi:hypothetical protein